MWSQSLLPHTVWMGCGKPATPPSQCQRTGVIWAWLPSLASLCHCFGACCLPVCPSGTSGLLCPPPGAVWLSSSVWGNPTCLSYAPLFTRSSRQWGRCTAVWGWFCARRCRCCTAALFRHKDQFLDISLTFWGSMKHQAKQTNKRCSFWCAGLCFELI